MTLVLIAASLAVFFGVQVPSSTPTEDLYDRATIPCEVVTGEPLDTVELSSGRCLADSEAPQLFPNKSIPMSLLWSLFLHGGLVHLLANMWSLWIFGNNVEDAFGRVPYVGFYLLSGLVASGAHVVLNPNSVVPIVGASGAIAGVMGAYLVLFPRARVTTWVVYLPIAVPAWIFLAVWLASQFLISAETTNVAWEAHIAGFVFGLLAATLLRPWLIRRLRSHHFPLQFVRQIRR